MGEIDAESGNGFSFDLEPNANPGWDSRDSETDKLGDVAIMVCFRNFGYSWNKKIGYYFSFCLYLYIVYIYLRNISIHDLLWFRFLFQTFLINLCKMNWVIYDNIVTMFPHMISSTIDSFTVNLVH